MNRHAARPASDTHGMSDQQQPAPAEPGQPRRRLSPLWIWFAILAPIAVYVVLKIPTGPDLSPAEQQFVDHQASTLDEDEALRIGNAICGMLDTGGERLTVQWLAGVDDLSRIGAVKPNPNPISMYDARQIAAAADEYLCA